MDDLHDHRLITASEYNKSIPYEPQQTFDKSHLVGLGEIYVKHNVHGVYGVGTLHRHILQSEGFILVHSTCDSVDICRPERLANFESGLPFVSSHFINGKKKFQGFEFTRTSRSQLSNEFLHEIRSYVLENLLSARFAIIGLPVFDDRAQVSVEYMVPGEQAMKTIPESQFKGQASYEYNLDVTGWAFNEGENGNVEWKEIAYCVRTAGAAHDPKNDSLPE